jgi:5-(carboxyamino)imidazole ribonucleotide synthase
MDETVLIPGDTIGILGGGQLGRMLALAAAPLGLKSHIYCPDSHNPAFDVTPLHTIGAYDDESALAEFAGSVDALTFEFENVPVAALDIVGRTTVVRPGRSALAAAQDRLAERSLFGELDIPVAPYAPVSELDELRVGLQSVGYPAVLKTRRLGYDGKGQVMIGQAADIEPALAAIRGSPAIVEAFIPFEREVSIIAARALDGSIATYDMAQNIHRDHILSETTVPAAIDRATAELGRFYARKLLSTLDYVGVLAIEFFDVGQKGRPQLIANEFAPRVHNSGHWTQDVCRTSQFAQHMRAVAGWPLGQTTRTHDVRMVNLIGSDVETWSQWVQQPGACLHLYGKNECRPGRKMGHVNIPTGEPTRS